MMTIEYSSIWPGLQGARLTGLTDDFNSSVESRLNCDSLLGVQQTFGMEKLECRRHAATIRPEQFGS